MAASGSGAVAPQPAAEARLKALYSVMQSIENKLGGGEGVEGLYGSIKKGGMDKVLECMRDKCGLGGDSVIVDIGAGLGRPLMHALLEPGVAGARGIEIDRIKCDKAAAFLRQAVLELQRRGMADDSLVPPPVECSAIEDVRSLDPCTHAYSFWEGVPIEGKAAFGALFAASRTMRSVAVVQRAIRMDPAEYMEDFGFGQLELVGSFAVSMSGSGRSFTAYLFNKAGLPAVLPAQLAVDASAAQSVETPAQAAEAAAVSAAGELDGDGAQSRLAAEAVGMGRGRRARHPSAKQAAAEEQEQNAAAVRQQGRSAREQRADRRAAAVWEAAKDLQVAEPQVVQEQQAAAALAPAAAQQQDVAAGGSPGKGRRAVRGTSRPAASGTALSKPAERLGSPQSGGVQKRGSPAKAPAAARSPEKAAAAAVGAAPPRRTSPRKLAASLAEAVQAPSKAAGKCAAAAAPATGGFLQRAARVIKSGLTFEGGAKLRTSPRKQAAASAAAGPVRRGLRSIDGPAA